MPGAEKRIQCPYLGGPAPCHATAIGLLARCPGLSLSAGVRPSARVRCERGEAVRGLTSLADAHLALRLLFFAALRFAWARFFATFGAAFFAAFFAVLERVFFAAIFDASLGELGPQLRTEAPRVCCKTYVAT